MEFDKWIKKQRYGKASNAIEMAMRHAWQAGAAVEQDALRDEIARLRTQRDYLLSAARRTLDENGHLADGDVCTLIVLKRAVETLTEVGAVVIA